MPLKKIRHLNAFACVRCTIYICEIAKRYRRESVCERERERQRERDRETEREKV